MKPRGAPSPVLAPAEAALLVAGVMFMTWPAAAAPPHREAARAPTRTESAPLRPGVSRKASYRT